jgi:hypothetical protein
MSFDTRAGTRGARQPSGPSSPIALFTAACPPASRSFQLTLLLALVVAVTWLSAAFAGSECNRKLVGRSVTSYLRPVTAVAAGQHSTDSPTTSTGKAAPARRSSSPR